MANQLTVKISDPIVMIDFYKLLKHSKTLIETLEIGYKRESTLHNLLEEYLQTIEHAINVVGKEHAEQLQ